MEEKQITSLKLEQTEWLNAHFKTRANIFRSRGKVLRDSQKEGNA
jgi:hypothetical protein